jgi:hypothetical protein
MIRVDAQFVECIYEFVAQLVGQMVGTKRIELYSLSMELRWELTIS